MEYMATYSSGIYINPERNLKIGDKVKIVRIRGGYENQVALQSCRLWREFIGSTDEIVRVSPDGCYYLKNIEGSWSEDELELILKPMNTLTNLAKRLLDPQIKTLIKAGYMCEQLQLTDRGKEALVSILFQEKKNDLVKLAEEDLAEEKEK